MSNKTNVKKLSKVLEVFEQKLEYACMNKALTKELLFLANKGQSYFDKGDIEAADSVLSTALLTIKRNLGTEISLRQGFELSSILVEDIRSHIADPAILVKDASDFAEGYFRIYSDNEFRDAGVPDYLMQRPFSEDYKNAANSIVKVIESFELPKRQLNILKTGIKEIEKQAAVFSKGKVTDDDLYIQNILITTLYFDMLDMQGIYLSQHQVMTVMGMIIFAVPAWLCAAPPAWIVQAIIVILGAVGYGIYRGMRYAATRKAYKNMWGYISPCKVSVRQALAKLKTETAGMDADQKKDIKDALTETLKKLSKMSFTGQKGKVARKLRALIAAL